MCSCSEDSVAHGTASGDELNVCDTSFGIFGAVVELLI